MMRMVSQAAFRPKKGLRLSSFRIVRRNLIDQIKSSRTPFPYISGLLLSASVNITNVDVRHEPREHGRSGYTLGKLVDVSYNLLINRSSIPLKFMGYIGVCASLLAFVTGVVFIMRKLLVGQAPTGWTSLIVLISFFSGLIILMLALLGEYVSRILREIANEKQYTIRESLQ
jgi:hypothetical protein